MIVDKPTPPSWKPWLLAEKVFLHLSYLCSFFLKKLSLVCSEILRKSHYFSLSFLPPNPALWPSLLSSKFTAYFSFLFSIYTCLMSKQELNSNNRNKNVATRSQTYTKIDEQLFLIIVNNTAVADVYSISRFQFV